jgi:hypothetical protein
VLMRLHHPDLVPFHMGRVEWRTPKLLEKLKCKFEGENNKRKKS